MEKKYEHLSIEERTRRGPAADGRARSGAARTLCLARPLCLNLRRCKRPQVVRQCFAGLVAKMSSPARGNEYY